MFKLICIRFGTSVIHMLSFLFRKKLEPSILAVAEYIEQILFISQKDKIVVHPVIHWCTTRMFKMTNSTILVPVSSRVLIFLVAFKIIAMIIGVLGNVTVIIYTILLCKEKAATSYLIANLALADLLVCSTFYPTYRRVYSDDIKH